MNRSHLVFLPPIRRRVDANLSGGGRFQGRRSPGFSDSALLSERSQHFD